MKSKDEEGRLSLPKANVKFLFYAEVLIGEHYEMQDAAGNAFRTTSTKGGYFRGDGLNGSIEPVGVEYMSASGEDRNDIEARHLLKTDDGEYIHLDVKGLLMIDPIQAECLQKDIPLSTHDYYYRLQITFKTGSKKYSWLNNKLGFAIGGITDRPSVCLDVYSIE